MERLNMENKEKAEKMKPAPVYYPFTKSKGRSFLNRFEEQAIKAADENEKLNEFKIRQ